MTMFSGKRKAALVLGLAVVAGVGSVFLLRPDVDGARGGAGGSSTSDATAGVAQGGKTALGGVDASTLEPGPEMPVATDAPREVAAGSATVALTYLQLEDETVEAAGYVAGVVESGGTCTLTLHAGADSVSVQSPGEADATTTTCLDLSIDATELAPGSWEAVLTYESDSTSGTSPAVALKVPTR
jgi:hypothetical protein